MCLEVLLQLIDSSCQKRNLDFRRSRVGRVLSVFLDEVLFVDLSHLFPMSPSLQSLGPMPQNPLRRSKNVNIAGFYDKTVILCQSTFIIANQRRILRALGHQRELHQTMLGKQDLD